MAQLCHLACCLVLAAAVGAAPARTEVLRTRTGAMVHWEGTEITVGLDRAAVSRTVAPEGVMQALRSAAEAWNRVNEPQPRFKVVTTPDAAVTISFCRGKWTGSSGDLGQSRFTADVRTGITVSATVELNECDRYFLAPDDAGDDRVDLQSVITHELGHVLGLGHSSNPDALMFPRGGTAGVRTPQPGDRAGLALIYRTAAAGTTSSTSERSPHKIIPAQPPEAPTSRREGNHSPSRIPPEVVSATTVSDGRGPTLTIYTCEPTLLPPLAPAQTDVRRREPRQSSRAK